MALFFYVKNSLGTRTTGGGTTKQTGSMATLGASNIYATIAAVNADSSPPVAGDFILISDAHSESTGANIAFTGTTGISAIPVQYVCVADANIDQTATASAVQFLTTSSGDIKLNSTNSASALSGLFLSSADNIDNLPGAHTTLTDCTLKVVGSGDRVLTISDDNGSVDATNMTLIIDSSIALNVTVGNGGVFRWRGGSLSSITTLKYLFTGDFITSGGIVEITGVDLSVIGGASSYLIDGVGNSLADDTMLIKFTRCKLASDLTGFSEELLYGTNKKLEVYNCSGTSAAAEYQFYVNHNQHVAQDYTTTYRNESEPFPDSSQKVSIEVVTAAHSSPFSPFYFDLLAVFAKLSNASTDTIRVFLTSDTALTDTDVWVEVTYPDGTNKHVSNVATSRNSNHLAAGTTLTTDSTSTYTAGKTNKYQIDIDTSGDIGIDCAPLIRVFIGKPSTTIYFDTSVDVVA